MKPLKRILALSTIVTLIVMLWLAPGINKAEGVEYVRKYEDTDAKAKGAENGDPKRKKAKSEKKAGKVYKEEKIKRGTKIARIRPSMYSRAIQFREVTIAEEDSLKVEVEAVTVVSADSTTLQ